MPNFPVVQRDFCSFRDGTLPQMVEMDGQSERRRAGVTDPAARRVHQPLYLSSFPLCSSSASWLCCHWQRKLWGQGFDFYFFVAIIIRYIRKLPTLLLSRTLCRKGELLWVELGCLHSLELNLPLYVLCNLV